MESCLFWLRDADEKKCQKGSGSKSTAHRRLQDWQQKKVWQKILSGAIKSAYKSGKMQLQKISVDSSSITAKKRAT